MDIFIFDPDIPPVVKGEIQRELEKLRWLIPGWCQRVHIAFDEDGNQRGVLISCSVMYEYRSIRLLFYPAFLSEGDRKFEHVIHDLLHGFSAVLVDYAETKINLLVPEDEAPKFRAALLDEMRIRHESFVQDLAFALAKKLDG